MLKSIYSGTLNRNYKNWEGDWELIEGIPCAISPSVVRPDISILCKEIEYIREVREVVIEIVSKLNLKKIRAFHPVNGKYRKFFDSDKGNLEFKVKDRSVIVNAERLF